MNVNSIKYLLTVVCAIACLQVIAQPTPPSSISSRIELSTGGCGGETDCTAGIVCYDVYVEIDEGGWNFQSYNLWFQYGVDSTILSYRVDSSCNHESGGIIDLNAFGLYRVLAANFSLPLVANQEERVHNICFAIKDYDALAGLTVSCGGNKFNLVSSANLVDQGNSSNAVNIQIDSSGLVVDASNLPCLEITPMAGFTCSATEIMLTCDPTDATGPAVMDCEAFSYSWEGPNSWTNSTQNPTIPVTNATAQSGVYTVTVTGAGGSCVGIESQTIDATNCAALPVEYLSFNAKKANTQVTLTWETSTEINNDLFEVERSVDGKEFRSIGTVDGNGTTFSTSRYTFVDKAPLESNYYRLRQLDFDGTAAYSNIRFIGYESDETGEKSVFPNPFVNTLNFDFGAPGLYQVELYSVTGELIKRLNIVNGASVNVSEFGPGVYMFKAYDALGNEVLVNTVIKLDRS